MTLNAYCHFGVIYKRSPAGFPVPTKLAEAALSSADEVALNLMLQELTWDVLANHSLSGRVQK